MTVYEIVTARIVEMLQQGTIPWRKPWRADAGEPRNLTSGKPYRGINVFLLCGAQHKRNYAEPGIMRSRQSVALGREMTCACIIVGTQVALVTRSAATPQLTDVAIREPGQSTTAALLVTIRSTS